MSRIDYNSLSRDRRLHERGAHQHEEPDGLTQQVQEAAASDLLRRSLEEGQTRSRAPAAVACRGRNGVAFPQRRVQAESH